MLWVRAMADSSFRSTASWKSWWTGKPIAKEIAESIYKHIDPTKCAGNGRLVTLAVAGKVTLADVQDEFKAKLTEGILLVYPPNKDASAYLLADAVLHLDILMGHSILGFPSANPMVESSRRDRALKDGTNLKWLLSYIRNSSGRHEKGRDATVTYLKELAASIHKPKRVSRSGSQASMSPVSPSTSSVATTIGLDGESLYADTGSNPSPSGVASKQFLE